MVATGSRDDEGRIILLSEKYFWYNIEWVRGNEDKISSICLSIYLFV